MNVSAWLPPILVTAGIGVIGWLIQAAVLSIKDKIDDLEASFIRVTSDLASQHRALEEKVSELDRRVTRVESWKEIVTLANTTLHLPDDSPWRVARPPSPPATEPTDYPKGTQ